MHISVQNAHFFKGIEEDLEVYFEYATNGLL